MNPRLRESILESFDIESLEMLLHDSLEKDLNALVQPGATKRRVYDLLRIAKQEGWLPQLLEELAKARPRNRKLKKYINEELDPSPGPDGDHPELIEQVQKCLKLLTQIHVANARIIRRGRSGSGPWAKILNDTYGRVCDTCHRRRLRTEPSDAYFDVICAEPDVKTVCVKKWELGQTLDDYRNRLNRVSPLPLDHDDLELFIRRSVAQPNWSPLELETAVGHAIEGAKPHALAQLAQNR